MTVYSCPVEEFFGFLEPLLLFLFNESFSVNSFREFVGCISKEGELWRTTIMDTHLLASSWHCSELKNILVK